DLGGGTFDATLMRARGDNEFETIGTDGEVVLGGRDWDERLLDYVVEEFKREAGVDPTEDPAVYQELVQRVEECKRTLSKRASAAVAVAYGGHRLRVPVSREKFEELTTDLLARTQSTLELIIDEAQMEWSQISRVLLVGGSSHMPMVQKMLKRVTGMDPEAKGEFELAVARGAAVQAAIMQSASGSGAAVPVPKIVVRDVNSHSLGVEVVDDAGAPANFPVIPKNSPIPCSVSQQFETVGISGPNSKISITVLEGEASDPSACIHVGRCVITDLPPGLPAGSPVKVTFSYSEDGRVEVEAEAVAVGLKAHAEIQRQNPLHPEQLEQEVKVMTKLSVL
ncbi:MAG: Hsp70 family protein, partial [Lentisphaeria bacterium]|nr:Hsp70 family protein [Lentisphaeria bacterium]